MNFTEFEYRFAKAILNQHHPDVQREVTQTITTLGIPLGRGYQPTPSETLQKAFAEKGWTCEKTIGQTGFARAIRYTLHHIHVNGLFFN